jgi:uncharacterized protein YyaL (SSP411 family)
MTQPSTTEEKPTGNRLAESKSPYLLQHADNPVDWYQWGPEAFAKAKEEDKPIFLSIGYATCHWCHVMEHESFEHPLVAALMNEAFVNIKVDREERPDIDQVYMTVCQMLTGSGGWPLTIIMSPDKEPFYAATYIPRESRHGRIGMLDLVPRVSKLWQSDRDGIRGTSEQILAALARMEGRSSGGQIDNGAIAEAFKQFAGRYDEARGGFGSAPKFPSPHNLVFLTRYSHHTESQQALHMVSKTLEQMRLGGLYDHIGFGFHRYSTDSQWLVPHFEKMLYDQAMLAMAYTEAWLATPKPVFERTVRETVTYVLHDMTSPEGGFYSADDADSEGEEGRYYLWTTDEVEKVLGDEDAAFAATVWNLEPQGNYRDEATGRPTGRNIPHLIDRFEDVARKQGVSSEDFEKRLESVRSRLVEVREQRIHPLKDDKVLSDWNGLMAAAMAFAGRVFNRPQWIETAKTAADFVLDTMRTDDSRLLHRYRDGDASIPAFLDDYVFMTTAMLELFDATFDPSFLERALQLQRLTDNLFWDPNNGGYFFTAADNEELLVRQKEVHDGAIPSGNSMAADNLVRLARLTGKTEYGQRADQIVAAFSNDVQQLPSAHSQLVSALQRRSAPSLEVVIAGEAQAADTKALIDVVRSMYLPHAAVLLVPPGETGASIRRLAPFTESYEPVDGRAAAYVCRDFTCQLPSTDPAKLKELLRKAITASDSVR